MTPRLGVLAASALGASLAAVPLPAQRAIDASVGGTFELTTVRSRDSSGSEALSGPFLVIDGTVRRGPWSLRLRYGQGRVTPDTAGNLLLRDVTLGDLQLGFRAREWLVLGGTLRARSYETEVGVQRWVFLEGHVRGEAPIWSDHLDGFLEGWLVVAGSSAAPERFEGGQGGEAGLVAQLTPILRARLAYRIEQARLVGARRETVEAVSLGAELAVKRPPAR